MTRLQTEAQYNAIVNRIEELLKLISNEEPSPEHILDELDVLSELAEEYEQEHFPLIAPTVAEVLQYKMAEKRLTQKEVAVELGISSSRVSEYIKGKAEPTLKIARVMCKKLDISPSLIMGL